MIMDMQELQILGQDHCDLDIVFMHLLIGYIQVFLNGLLFQEVVSKAMLQMLYI